jgi:putative zinc finger protein
MTCQEVQRELSNYFDGELPAEVCTGMQGHFRTCERCAALLQDMRDTVLALGDERLLDVPPGYGTRLYRKLKDQLAGPGSSVGRNVSTEILLGITNDVVDLGSHLIYFWQSDEEFARGVRFLEPGLVGEDHCIVFGHDEATERVFRLLQAKGFDTESLTQ